MTSEAREVALLGGQPIKLFRFSRGVLTWFYTSADRDITFNGDVYLATAIEHTAMQDGGESNKVSIQITLPKSLTVADNWRPYSPADTIAITIWTWHQGEADFLVDWIGRIISPQYDDTKLTLTSEPSVTKARRNANGRSWQRGCDVVLYSQGNGLCNVDLSLHAIPATLTAVEGLTLTAAEFLAFPVGRLAGGFISWQRADGLVEYRTIESHSGNTITLDYGGADLAVGLAITVAPGCGQSWDDCVYFDNTDNYGGELWMPTRDYYDGNPVR